MIQGYFLSLFYLIMTSLICYQSKYRLELSFMLRFTDNLEKNKKLFVAFISMGFVTTAILLFFPESPGPRILGDLIPALMVFYNTLYILVMIKRKEKNASPDCLDMRKGERKIALARLSAAVAVLHFLLPSFVLI